MYKKVLMGILGLAVSLMFTSGAMAQEKAPVVAAVPAQEMKVEKSDGVINMEKKDVVVENHEDKLSLSDGDKTKHFEGKNEAKLSDRTRALWALFFFRLNGD